MSDVDSLELNQYLSRTMACARRHPRLALPLLGKLEQYAAHAKLHQVRLDILYQRFFTLEFLGEALPLFKDLQIGLSLAEIYHLPVQAARLSVALGRISFTSGRYKVALRYWADSLNLSHVCGDALALIEAWIGLGQLYGEIGDWEHGASCLSDASSLLIKLDDPYLNCKHAIIYANFHLRLGNRAQAHQLLTYAVEQAQRGGIHEYAARAHWHLAEMHLYRGELLTAESELALASTLAEQIACPQLQAAIKNTFAALCEENGKHDAAIASYQEALEEATQAAPLTRQRQCCLDLARLYEDTGDLATALMYSKRAQAHSQQLLSQAQLERCQELLDYDLSRKSSIELILELSVMLQSEQGDVWASLQLICASAIDILRINLICLWLFEPSEQCLVCHYLISPSGLNFAVGDEFPNAQASNYFAQHKDSHQPLVLHDVSLHPAAQELSLMFGNSGLQSMIEVPLRLHGEFVGIISFGLCHSPRIWSREEVLLASHIANLLQQNLSHIELYAVMNQLKQEAESRIQTENALQQSYDELKERDADLIKLSTIGRELTSTLDLELAFERVYQQVSARLDAYVFGIGILDEAKQEIAMVYLIEDKQRQACIVFKLAERARPAVWCVREKRDLVVSERPQLAAYVGPLLPVLFGSGSMQSLVYLPLLVGGAVIGCLTVQSPQQHAFQPDQLDFLRALASYAAITVSNSLAHSELAVAHKKMQATQQQLVLHEKMAGLGTLTAGVAHEINNPTNFVHVAVQNMEVDVADFKNFVASLVEADEAPEILQAFEQRFSQLSRHITIMRHGTERIKSIVKDLRGFTRIGEAEKRTVRLSECIISTLNLVRTTWQDQVKFTLQLNSDPEIVCWPALLNQVFMNILVNGCQAIAEKKYPFPELGQLEIRLRHDKDHLIAEFEDNGIGISSENQSRIMEPFFTTKDVGHGTGLGLSIAYDIIEKHHGSLQFSSTPGHGSCFSVSLPFTTLKLD